MRIDSLQTKRILLILLLTFSVAKAIKQLSKLHFDMTDFYVYETAAVLVHGGQNNLIYEGADTGVDPQERLAPAQSTFAATARALGQPETQMYVYPPLLADLLVPFTYMSALWAGRLWITVNIAALVAIALLTMSMLKIRWKSWGAVAVFIAFFSFYPTISCINWGQIAILLFLLWTLGIFFYGRGWIVASASMFAIAAAIKMTPVIAVVPFLLWKEWRWLRAFSGVLFGLLLVVYLVNGPQCLADFAFHVMPPMANGVVLWTNRSLQASFEMLNVASMGRTIEPGAYVSPGFVLLGKAACALAGLLAVLLVARSRKRHDPASRAVTLALFATLAAAISPVSWEHGYVVWLLVLVYLWTEVFRTRTSTYYLAALTVGSLEFSWFFFSYIVVHHVRGMATGLASFITPVFAIGLVFLELAKLNAPRAEDGFDTGAVVESEFTLRER